MDIPLKIRARVSKLKRNCTRAELCLHRPLEILCKSHNLSLQFQHPIKLYAYRWSIVDFLIDSKLIIELDGVHHLEDPSQIAKDKDRDSRLRSLGYKVLRFSNQVVLQDPISLAMLLISQLLKAKGQLLTISRYDLELEVERLTMEKLGITSF